MGSVSNRCRIHAIHYHQINVANRQQELLATEALPLDDLLTPPLATDTNWSEEEKLKELENNRQVSWVMSFVGLIWV